MKHNNNKTLPDMIRATKKMSEAMGVNIFDCPLFLYHGQPQSDNVPDTDTYLDTDAGARVEKGMFDYSFRTLIGNPLPFQKMRAVIELSAPQGHIEKWNPSKIFTFVHTIDPNYFMIVGQYMVLDGAEEAEKVSIAFYVEPEMHSDGSASSERAFIRCVACNTPGIGCEVFKPENHAFFGHHPNHIFDPKFDIVILICQWILWSVAEMALGINQMDKRIIEVTPNPNAREVRWLQGRKHFVILSNREAAERSADSEAFKVKACEPISRMSHARRAHSRVLRSPRFRHKMGKRIFVKETWVGPKEWVDKSQSTYKVLLG